MKYYNAPSAQEPIMSADKRTVIGWVLSVRLECDDHVVEHIQRYDMPEEDWFPISEMSALSAPTVHRGHIAMNTLAQAEAKMDALVNADE